MDWLKSFLALPAAQARTALRASALDLAGAYALNLGYYKEAQSLKEEALSIFRECGTPAEIAYTLFHLGHLSGFMQCDCAAARKLYQEGLELLRDNGHQELFTFQLGWLAHLSTAI